MSSGLARITLMSLSALIISASTTTHSDAALSPYAVGAIALGILLALLGALVAFGGGREHS